MLPSPKIDAWNVLYSCHQKGIDHTLYQIFDIYDKNTREKTAVVKNCFISLILTTKILADRRHFSAHVVNIKSDFVILIFCEKSSVRTGAIWNGGHFVEVFE